MVVSAVKKPSLEWRRDVWIVQGGERKPHWGGDPGRKWGSEPGSCIKLLINLGGENSKWGEMQRQRPVRWELACCLEEQWRQWGWSNMSEGGGERDAVRDVGGLEPGRLMERVGIFLSSQKALESWSWGMTWCELHSKRITLAAI